MKLNIVDRFLSTNYRKLGSLIGRHPSYFIVIPIFVSCILATGIQRIDYVSDITYLFSPYLSRATKAKDFIDKHFPTNLSAYFDPGRFTRRGRFGSVLLVCKDGQNILHQDVLRRVLEVDKLVHQINFEKEGRKWFYEDICSKSNEKCFPNPIIQALKMNKTVFQFPLAIEKNSFQYFFFGANLGGVKTTDDGYVISAQAVRLLYFLNDDNSHDNELALEWEKAFINALANLHYDDLVINRYASTSVESEFHRSTLSTLPLLMLIGGIVLLFAAATSITSNWMRNKPWSGVIGCLSTGLAVSSSFGLLMYVGVPYIDMNMAVPFLSLGIGMDDTFVMLAAWRRTDSQKNVEQRLGQSYSESAVSITITSLTNLITFCFGMTTPFRSIRIFSVYIVCCILFSYIYQLTFVGGCMAICGHAEENGLHAVTCAPVEWNKSSNNKGTFYKLFCLGKGTREDYKETFLVTFWYKLSDILSNPYAKVALVIVFAIHLAGAGWGCSQLQEKVDLRDFVTYDSYVMRYLNSYRQYFRRYQSRIQIVIKETMDYSDPSVQQHLEDLLRSFETSDYLSDFSLTESWLRDYLKFSRDTRGKFLLQGYNISSKEGFTRGLREVFLKLHITRKYKNDIVFSEDNQSIVTSRFLCQTNETSDTNSEIKMALNLRNIADSSSLPVLVYNHFFLFVDHNLMVLPLTLQTISLAAGVVAIVTFLFLPSLKCVICVTLTIISIQVGVIGYMTLWQVKLDPIAMINLIMCVGFSVDYSAHIVYSFISCKDKIPGAAIRKALGDVGLPIFQGSVSTVLSVVVFVDPPSYLYGVFFKIVVLVIFFAAVHGLVLLPLLLSLTDSTCVKSWNLPKPTLEANNGAQNMNPVEILKQKALSPPITNVEIQQKNHYVVSLHRSLNENGEYINDAYSPDLPNILKVQKEPRYN